MYPVKEEYFLPKDKRFAMAIKERISNRLKEYYRWIKNKTWKEILNYYYLMEYETWLCDKSILLQS